ncbi:MAG: aminodeoxychorismate/anthranilate synthase component II [Clostridia bacterium]|nr:aminodeoxychorismate/anthranilate synthase component II [Clostridia bacterium]MDH7572328.1 aminodeoxychorismate/anthranilate synthase component II [Clostridia bacterium]
MVVLIDNYDSFTYNLYQALAVLGAEVRVYRHDAVTVEELLSLPLEALVVSPGPGAPEQAGISSEAISALRGKVPILGVCLGHQCLGRVWGARVVRARYPVHGETSLVYHDGRTIYRGLPNPFVAARYHSLIVDPQYLPEELEVSAWTAEGEIMGLRHRYLAVEGVQFHPESVLTPEGSKLLANFLDFTGSREGVDG